MNLAAERVVRVMGHIAAWRGYQSKLRVDNGPEFVAVAIADWVEEHGALVVFTQPGRPIQNGDIERFDRSYREGVLGMYVFVRSTRCGWAGLQRRAF